MLARLEARFFLLLNVEPNFGHWALARQRHNQFVTFSSSLLKQVREIECRITKSLWLKSTSILSLVWDTLQQLWTFQDSVFRLNPKSVFQCRSEIGTFDDLYRCLNNWVERPVLSQMIWVNRDVSIPDTAWELHNWEDDEHWLYYHCSYSLILVLELLILQPRRNEKLRECEDGFPSCFDCVSVSPDMSRNHLA